MQTRRPVRQAHRQQRQPLGIALVAAAAGWSAGLAVAAVAIMAALGKG